MRNLLQFLSRLESPFFPKCFTETCTNNVKMLRNRERTILAQRKWVIRKRPFRKWKLTLRG